MPNQSSRFAIDDLQAALAANDTEAIVEFVLVLTLAKYVLPTLSG